MVQVVRHTLSNGLRILVVPQPHLQGASLGVYVKVGSRYESLEDNGLSHFLEHMLFRGTEAHDSAYALNLAAERLGGTLEAATHTDFTSYSLTVPHEHALEALDVLAQMMTRPRLLDLELEKQVVCEEILADLGDEGQEVDPDNLAGMLMYGQHPLSYKLTGDADNVKRFGDADLRRHLARHYTARNMVVCVAGAVDPEQVIQRGTPAFAALPPGQPTLIERPPPSRHGERFRFVKNPGSQTDLRVMLWTFGEDDPECAALSMLLSILDDGMSTRLHRRMTDDSGLAYDVYADSEHYEDVGVFEIGATVDHAKVPEVTRAAIELLRQLRDNPVTEQELDKARMRNRWDLRYALDDTEGMAELYGTNALFGRPDTWESMQQELERVTASDVQRVARRVIREENLYVVCVGVLNKKLQQGVRTAMAELPLQARLS